MHSRVCGNSYPFNPFDREVQEDQIKFPHFWIKIIAIGSNTSCLWYIKWVSRENFSIFIPPRSSPLLYTCMHGEIPTFFTLLTGKCRRIKLNSSILLLLLHKDDVHRLATFFGVKIFPLLQPSKIPEPPVFLEGCWPFLLMYLPGFSSIPPAATHLTF